MSPLGKGLLASALTLPLVAFVAGVLASPDPVDPHRSRPVIIGNVTNDEPADDNPRVRPPQENPKDVKPPTPRSGGDDDGPDDDSDDGPGDDVTDDQPYVVVTPPPRDLDDDEDSGDDDDDDNSNGSGGGGSGDD